MMTTTNNNVYAIDEITEQKVQRPFSQDEFLTEKLQNFVVNNKAMGDILIPQGMGLSLPTIPVDVNFRSEHLENFSSFLNNKVSDTLHRINPIMDFLNTSFGDIEILLFAVILLNVRYKSSLLKALLGTVFGIYLVTKMSDGIEKALELYIAQAGNIFNADPEDVVDMEEIVPQAGPEDFTVYSELLLMLLHGSFGMKPRASILKSVIEVTKISDSQRHNVSGMIMKTMNAISSFFMRFSDDSTIGKYFYVDMVNDVDVKVYQLRVDEFLISVRTSPSSQEAIIVLYDQLVTEGKKLSNGLDRLSFDKKVVDGLLVKLFTYRSHFLGAQTSDRGSRPEPVGVLFMGASGCAKTIAMTRLAGIITEYGIAPELVSDFRSFPHNYIYTKANDKFWDGYPPSAFATIIDDIFQAREVAGTVESEALQVIKMINTASYPLASAEAATKNTMFFKSKAVLATTNLTDFSRIETVISSAAVQRRFTFEIKVTVSKEYIGSNGKVLAEYLPLLDDEENHTFFPNDFWVFNVTRKFADSESLEEVMTLESLALSVLDAIEVNETRHMVNNKVDKLAKEQVMQRLRDRRNAKKIFLPQSCYSPDEHETEAEYAVRFKQSYYASSVEATSEFWSGMLALGLQLTESKVMFGNSLEIFANVLYRHDYDLDFSDVEGLVDALRDAIEKDISNDIDSVSGLPNLKPNSFPKFRRLLSVFVEKLKAFSKYLIPLGILISLCSAAYLLIKKILHYFFPCEDLELVRKPGVVVDLKDLTVPFTPQSYNIGNVSLKPLPKLKCDDFIRTVNSDVIIKVLNTYLFTMYIAFKLPDGTIDYVRMGSVTNVKGNVFMLNFHFILILLKRMKAADYIGSQVILMTGTKSTVYAQSSEDFIRCYKPGELAMADDVAMVVLPNAQLASKGALNYYVTEETMEKWSRLVKLKATLLCVQPGTIDSGNLILKVQNVVVSQSTGRIPVAVSWEPGNDKYALANTITYQNAMTSNGDCGSPLFSSHCDDNRCIMGMHAAAGSDLGVSIRLTQEKIKGFLDEIDYNETTYLSEEVIGVDKYMDIKSQGNMLPLAKMKVSHTPVSSSRSDLTKSRLYNKLDGCPRSVKSTARLMPFIVDGERISPDELALQRFGKSAPAIPMLFISEATNSYEQVISANMKVKLSERRLLSIEEALDTFGFLKRIDSSTSAGFPYNTPSTGNIKKTYYSSLRNGDESSTESLEAIVKSVTEKKTMIESGIRPFVPYTANLKDEKVSIKKNKSGQSRLFAGSSFDLLILFRMYFGSFASGYIEANISVGSAIGVNPYSKEWDMMARDLLKNSASRTEKCIGAGDFKSFDGSESPVILNQILLIINRWYGPSNKADNDMRKLLWSEITNSRVIFRGFLYEWFTSMPSGNPLTAIINTMYNNIVFRVAWQVAGLDPRLFNTSVRLQCLGDDNIFSVDPNYRGKFNELIMPELMAKCGMTYTTELKSVAEVPFRSISEVEFLKRSFAFIPTMNRWTAPLRPESIYESIYWSKKGTFKDQITADSVATGLREFALHGEKSYHLHYDIFTKAMQDFMPDSASSTEMSPDFEYSLNKILSSDFKYYF